MELYTGKSLEEYCNASASFSNAMFHSSDDENLNTIHCLYGAAHQWLQGLKEKGRLLNAYIGAVHRCPRGYLDFSVRGDEVEFRQKALKHVNLPVENERQIFFWDEHVKCSVGCKKACDTVWARKCAQLGREMVAVFITRSGSFHTFSSSL